MHFKYLQILTSRGDICLGKLTLGKIFLKFRDSNFSGVLSLGTEFLPLLSGKLNFIKSSIENISHKFLRRFTPNSLLPFQTLRVSNFFTPHYKYLSTFFFEKKTSHAFCFACASEIN